MNFNYVLIVYHINNDIINIEDKKEKKRKKKKLQHMKQGNVNLITLH